MKKNLLLATVLVLALSAIPLASHVAGSGQDLYATNIAPQTTISSLDGLTVMRGEEALTGDAYLATGDIIIKDGNEYIAIVKGDVNGDGQINSTDFMQVRRAFLSLYKLDEVSAKAADVNDDGTVNSTDFMQIRRHYLKLFNICPDAEEGIIFGQPASVPESTPSEESSEPTSSEPTSSEATSSEPTSSEPESPSSTYSITIGPGEDESGWGPIF